MGSFANPNGIGPINPPIPTFTFPFEEDRVPIKRIRKPMTMSIIPNGMN